MASEAEDQSWYDFLVLRTELVWPLRLEIRVGLASEDKD